MMRRDKLMKGVLIVVAALSAAAIQAVQADQKKDIPDPVLNEVIVSFETRMPRFIKMRGNDVFVADEKITRGSLLLALYEYDHSLKIPQKNYVTRQELDELKSRLMLIEKSPSAVAKSEKTSSIDIAALLNELQPNMPVLLDNTLAESKVFKELRDEIRNRHDAAVKPGSTVSTATDSRDIAVLLQRVENLEQSQGIKKLSQKTEVTRKDIDRIENRIEDLTFIAEGSSLQENEGRSSTFLTKVGVGLGMVAAFLVVR